MTIIESIFGVFDAISEWLTGAVSDLIPMFYDSSTGLTMLGTLAVVGLGISVVFLLIGLIQNFLHFRGQFFSLGGCYPPHFY